LLLLLLMLLLLLLLLLNLLLLLTRGMSQAELKDHMATGHGLHTFTEQDILNGATKNDWEESVRMLLHPTSLIWNFNRLTTADAKLIHAATGEWPNHVVTGPEWFIDTLGHEFSMALMREIYLSDPVCKY
jgi:hypothetical protein